MFTIYKKNNALINNKNISACMQFIGCSSLTIAVVQPLTRPPKQTQRPSNSASRRHLTYAADGTAPFKASRRRWQRARELWRQIACRLRALSRHPSLQIDADCKQRARLYCLSSTDECRERERVYCCVVNRDNSRHKHKHKVA